MKKTIRVLALLLCAVLLSGCCLKHEWKEATCEEPITCAKCGKTEGEENGHSAGAMERVSVPMWGEPGISRQLCLVCGDTVAEEHDELTMFGEDGNLVTDIQGLCERLETVLKTISEEFSCKVERDETSSFECTILVDHKGVSVAEILMYPVDGSLLDEDVQIDGVSLMTIKGTSIDMEKTKDIKVYHQVILGFVGCFDTTISLSEAEALTEKIDGLIDQGKGLQRAEYDGDSVVFKVTSAHVTSAKVNAEGILTQVSVVP